MRKIKDLLKDHERVFFYLGESKDTQSLFEKELQKEGFVFMDGSEITEGSIGRLMSIHSNGKVAYISLMVWKALWKGPCEDIGFIEGNSIYNVPRVDYIKYHNGDDDYILKKSMYTAK